MDEKAIKSLMQRAGFTWIQRESIYNRERVERLVSIARNEALEEAAIISDSLAEDWSFAANRISKNIRALKESK